MSKTKDLNQSTESLLPFDQDFKQSQKSTIKLRPLFAAMNALASTLCFSTNFMLIKLMNTMEPKVSPFLLLTTDALVCVALLTPIANVKTQTNLYHSLVSPLKVLDFLTLFVGLGHIVFIMLIIFWCMKRLPIVSVSIFLNLGPLLTVLLAVYVLKEKASIFSFVQAGFSFIGVVCIVLGHQTTETSSDADAGISSTEEIILYGLLAITPIVIALGNFKASVISQHPDIEIHFIPWWVNLLCVLIFGFICIFQQVYMPTSLEFWSIAILSGISNILSWHFKVTAFRNDIVSRVSPISYLESIFGLLIDAFVFNTAFGILQLVGIGLVFLMFLIKIGHAMTIKV